MVLKDRLTNEEGSVSTVNAFRAVDARCEVGKGISRVLQPKNRG